MQRFIFCAFLAIASAAHIRDRREPLENGESLNRLKRQQSYSPPNFIKLNDKPSFDVNALGSLRTGLNLNVAGSVPLFRSEDNRNKLNALGSYSQNLSPNGNSRPDFGLGLSYSHKLNNANNLNAGAQVGRIVDPTGGNRPNVGVAVSWDHRLRNGNSFQPSLSFSNNLDPGFGFKPALGAGFKYNFGK